MRTKPKASHGRGDVSRSAIGVGLQDDAALGVASLIGAVRVSVVIPCLNEAENVEQCVSSALATLESNAIDGEVIVVDNGSEDGSAALAEGAGARVVLESRRGYGSAYLAGLAAARGEFIVMADADLTYDFAEIPRFLERLEAGADMVLGDRMRNIEAGAMPWHHRYIGNPVLSGLLNLLFHAGVNDAHCGMRGVRRECLEELELRTIGMEFASEMVVNAVKSRLVIDELPIAYRRRGGESKLVSFRDGWRHLRYLLLHSPRHLFILPGLALALLGGVLSLTVLAHVSVLGRSWDLHTLIGGSLLLTLGAQVVGLGLCAQAFASNQMGYRDPWFEGLRGRVRLEHGLILGSLLALAGLAVIAVVFADWLGRGLGSLAQERLAISGATLVVLGAQVLFCSFLLSMLGLRRA
jgi:glycosyltransferase involved in cell wall biosynthesis